MAEGGSERELRSDRTLTPKGEELYSVKKDALLSKVTAVQTILDDTFKECDSGNYEHAGVQHDTIRTKLSLYHHCASNYVEFLEAQRTQKDSEEAIAVKAEYERCVSTSQKVIKHLGKPMRGDNDADSNCSGASKASSTKAKAAASQTKLVFAKRKAALQNQKADLEAENQRQEAENQRQKAEFAAENKRKRAHFDSQLLVLDQEGETAALETEAEYLVAAERGLDDPYLSRLPFQNTTGEDSRTAQYVRGQNGHHNDSFFENSEDEDMPRRSHRPMDVTFNIPDSTSGPSPRSGRRFTSGSSTPTMDFTKMMFRRDLLMSRLSNYDDLPEHFELWSSSFQSVADEMEITASEEMDLLLRYLGPESRKYATNLRAANPGRPERGLQLLWERLKERYGCPELIIHQIQGKVKSLDTITFKSTSKLYDLVDVLEEISTLKDNPRLSLYFSMYDTPDGVNPIVSKLPHPFKQRWISLASRYKTEHSVLFPPFSFFVSFVKGLAKTHNDPAFVFEDSAESKPNSRSSQRVHTRKTNLEDKEFSNKDRNKGESTESKCPIHKSDHSLLVCKAFASKTFDEKREFLREKGFCFKCLLSDRHRANQCEAKVTCGDCGRTHQTIMHVQRQSQQGPNARSPLVQNETTVKSSCTKICGSSVAIGRSCGKFVLTKVSFQGKCQTVYAMLDDQSNRSLATPELLDSLGVQSPQHSYQMTSCSGTDEMHGRHAEGLQIHSLDGKSNFQLPCVIECSSIPQDRSEIPSSDIASAFSHMSDIADSIPNEVDAPIALLIGRDLPVVHHVLEQKVGGQSDPFAQRLPLGWVIVGEVCLDKRHRPSGVKVNKLSIEPEPSDSIGSHVKSCPNKFDVVRVDKIGETVFVKTLDDEKVSTSVDDRSFLDMMDRDFQKNDQGRWSVHLPFRLGMEPTVSNKSQAFFRAKMLHKALEKNEQKKDHFFLFMSKLLASGASERAPHLAPDTKCWYLPLFGVYHPRKPDKIRGVFDSSAVFEGQSLNDKMFSGPDLTNSLVGILLRFRKDGFPIMADIEQMFYQFYVDENHRDFLRFFWYEDNDFNKPLVEYRMCVHVFGNSPSPAVATYGLRKTVETSHEHVKQFVCRDFYIDDGVKSGPDRKQVIDLMQSTRHDLMENGKIRLHKIASSDREILKAFDSQELSENLRSIDFGNPEVPLPIHSCLGLSWDLESDSFILNFPLTNTPFTRRGLLSALNSIYDPLGFLSPATVAGKILLREISPNGKLWDEPLSEDHKASWESWKKSTEVVQGLKVPRMYVPSSLSCDENLHFHVFCDASEKAIAAVAYVCSDSSVGQHLGFVMGKAKVAPSSGHTIPRLELCSAVLAVDLWELIADQLDLKPEGVTFYSDSKIVLGYINNERRRFHTYVSNRVQRIRHVSKSSQWKHVPTDRNPADVATRSSDNTLLDRASVWLSGPKGFEGFQSRDSEADAFPLVSPDEDSEVRVVVKKTIALDPSSICSRFEKFSSWGGLVKALALLKHVGHSFHSPSGECSGWHKCAQSCALDWKQETEKFVLRVVQENSFSSEIECLRKGQKLPRSSPLLSLAPFLDADGLLRLGGRVHSSPDVGNFSVSEHPIIVPKGHVAKLLVLHFHDVVRHQGRHMTEGSIRSNGYWILGAKRLVSSVIHACFICRLLRGKFCQQKMANLPADRVTPSAPFSHVGVDCFGPWMIQSRRTRGGLANSKRWAVMFTCLAVRAVHIEVIEEMSTSSFINAFRRFTALRGPVKEIRSDRGTNFVGAATELDVNWVFNSPHSSHMGGVWERMIGLTRRVLDCMLRDERRKSLTHEVLTTFMAEVCAIINSRPITPVSHDPSYPALLTPASILSMKFDSNTSNLIDKNLKNAYQAHWKHVQVLSDAFWKRWKTEYLDVLEPRSKWTDTQSNLKPDDLVLLRDSSSRRTEWPVGIVTRIFPSSDSLVRKVEVKQLKAGKPVLYTRPITELVRL